MFRLRLPRLPSLLRPISKPPTNQTTTRTLHASLRPPPAPLPTPTVPDVPTFLTLIGRSAHTHASKLPTWDSLFTSTSAQLKNAGVEPARLRRYIIWWRERYRLHGGRVQVCEVKRGVKKDGGERRRKMVRAKRGVEEWKARKREQGGGAQGEQPGMGQEGGMAEGGFGEGGFGFGEEGEVFTGDGYGGKF